MIDATVFAVVRLVLFFVGSLVVFRSLQAVDFSKFFVANSGERIKTLVILVSIVLGYLFADVIASLFEQVNSLLG